MHEKTASLLLQTSSFNDYGNAGHYTKKVKMFNLFKLFKLQVIHESHADPKLGDLMPDGTVYAGISPETGTSMYVTPSNAPEEMNWKQAMGYAARLDAHGHKDWAIPTKDELKMLFNNRAAVGGFAAACYWSSTEDYDTHALYQSFSYGSQYVGTKYGNYAVRCLRRD